VYPVFQNRFNKAVQRVHAGIRSNELGAIRIASVRVRWCRPQRYYDMAPWRGTYAMDGGALTNQGIHHLDLLRYLGGDLAQVSAQMGTSGAQIEVEDSVVAHMEFRSGAIGSLEITTAARPIDFEASISLVCEHGLAQIGGIAVNELQIFTPKPEDCAKFSEDFSGNVYGHGHSTLYRSIADCRAGISPYIIDESDCSGSIGLLHAFYRSAALGKKVEVTANEEFERLGEANESLAALYRVKQ
jgi:UDP-N-acetyl-2-amino-2-deoxyglucuronate dehydrogenase